MNAEFLLQPIKSLEGFIGSHPSDSQDTLLTQILAGAGDRERRYPANIVIYGGGSKAAEEFARKVRAVALADDAIWRVGIRPSDATDRDFWVPDDDPALELINARLLFVPEGEDFAHIRDEWTNRADVTLVENSAPAFNAAEGYPLPAAEPEPERYLLGLLRNLGLSLAHAAYGVLDPGPILAFKAEPPENENKPTDDKVPVGGKRAGLQLTAQAASERSLMVTVTALTADREGSNVRLVVVNLDNEETICEETQKLTIDNKFAEWEIPVPTPDPKSIVCVALVL